MVMAVHQRLRAGAVHQFGQAKKTKPMRRQWRLMGRQHTKTLLAKGLGILVENRRSVT